MEPQKTQPITVPEKSSKLYKIVCLVLVVLLGVCVFLWQPWNSKFKATDRTITVTGDATVKATPDLYVFTPTYEFTNADSKVAIANLTAKSDEINKKLKELGVPSEAIKSNSGGYERGVSYSPIEIKDGKSTYNLSFTITLGKLDLSQKVQDYLVTTSPTNTLSPTVSFSVTSQKKLTAEATVLAEKDARSKADQSAKNLGFKIVGVKSVQEGSLGGPILMDSTQSGAEAKTTNSLAIQPGQNEVNYSVSVVYYIK